MQSQEGRVKASATKVARTQAKVVAAVVSLLTVDPAARVTQAAVSNEVRERAPRRSDPRDGQGRETVDPSTLTRNGINVRWVSDEVVRQARLQAETRRGMPRRRGTTASSWQAPDGGLFRLLASSPQAQAHGRTEDLGAWWAPPQLLLALSEHEMTSAKQELKQALRTRAVRLREASAVEPVEPEDDNERFIELREYLEHYAEPLEVYGSRLTCATQFADLALDRALWCCDPEDIDDGLVEGILAQLEVLGDLVELDPEGTFDHHWVAESRGYWTELLPSAAVTFEPTGWALTWRQGLNRAEDDRNEIAWGRLRGRLASGDPLRCRSAVEEIENAVECAVSDPRSAVMVELFLSDLLLEVFEDCVLGAWTAQKNAGDDAAAEIWQLSRRFAKILSLHVDPQSRDTARPPARETDDSSYAAGLEMDADRRSLLRILRAWATSDDSDLVEAAATYLGGGVELGWNRWHLGDLTLGFLWHALDSSSAQGSTTVLREAIARAVELRLPYLSTLGTPAARMKQRADPDANEEEQTTVEIALRAAPLERELRRILHESHRDVLGGPSKPYLTETAVLELISMRLAVKMNRQVPRPLLEQARLLIRDLEATVAESE
jgi:hypothetical protein